MSEAIGPYSVEERVIDGDIRWVAIRARGAEWSWLTPAEAARLGQQWVERYGGQTLEVDFTVDDPGAFNMAWSASQRYKKIDQPVREIVCAEGEAFAPKQDPQQNLVPIPKALDPDF